MKTPPGNASAAPPQPDVEALHSALNEYMRRKGLRSTSQRRLVCDIFFRSRGHLSIDDLLALVRKRDAAVGYATVYRTLKLLSESGLAYERQFRDGPTRYELAHADDHHDHLICVQCGAIEEFEDREIEALQEAVARRHGFALSSHRHELYGVCAGCQRARA
jgi:Fur family ferric uptake transcriptional regulator